VATANIYQICYSEETRKSLDPGFHVLDNMTNLRPDWREYWPIRNVLLNNQLNEREYYGFFSPKFGAKTNLSAAEVHEFIRKQDGKPDVIHFSPFFDQSAFSHNVFAQFTVHNSGLKIMEECIAAVTPGYEKFMLAGVMDSRNTIYCNFFVARPSFWKMWLYTCEILFKIAEEKTTSLGVQLNELVPHDGHYVPAKVFMIERMASLMLILNNLDAVAFDPWKLPHSNSKVAKYVGDLICMDALKVAFRTERHESYMTRHQEMAVMLVERIIANEKKLIAESKQSRLNRGKHR
jgi:hypothetical protein